MDDEDVRTIWCGNLNEKCTEDILYELFLQGGPVQKVSIPKDRDGKQKNFGFVTYKHVCSVPYALDLLDGTALFNRPLNMKSRNNSIDTYNHHQQQQQQQQQQLQPGNAFDMRQREVQNNLMLGQQILSGCIAPLAFAANHMSMMPNPLMYPSQNNLYSQTAQNSSQDYNRGNRRGKYHPYQDREPERGGNDRERERDHYNDRRINQHNQQESFNRDHKSYKHSSHRSNRHDNRRKYR